MLKSQQYFTNGFKGGTYLGPHYTERAKVSRTTDENVPVRLEEKQLEQYDESLAPTTKVSDEKS